MNRNTITPFAVVGTVIAGLVLVSCANSSSSDKPFPTKADNPPPAQSQPVEVNLEDSEVRDYLANAFRSLDAADQDTVCASWLVSSPAERFDLYTSIVAGVDGISDAQIDAVFPAYFESVCS